MQPTEQKKKQLIKLAEDFDKFGVFAILEYIQEFEDKIDEKIGQIESDSKTSKLPPELIAKIKQLKGDPGENGKDGVSPEVDYGFIIREVASQIPEPQNGKDAVVDYQKIISDVLKRIKVPEVDYSRVIEDVLALIRLPEAIKGDPGDNGSPDTGEEIIAKINDSDGEKIDASKIKNLPKQERIIERIPVGSGSSQVYHDSTMSGNGTQSSPLTITTPATSPNIQTYTPSASGTTTLDLSKGNVHHITMPAGNITIALSNGTIGQCFIIRILQDSVGSRTVTWFTTIRWAGGSAPTLTTTADKADTLGFEITGSSTYDGFVVGQNI